ncbi:Uncharacterised protein [Neisseria gonorrhoeae]|uniref:Uncharacterized protein n=1 Tax=Neisseria gonorrhoeae TaxID=485 RepID=A0A378VVT6_NEIGO|nr:Uncharacterised protein [Neisseria gonorrhoeae]
MRQNGAVGQIQLVCGSFWDIPCPVTGRIASSLYSTEYFVVCFLRLMPLSPCNLYLATHLRTNESEMEKYSELTKSGQGGGPQAVQMVRNRFARRSITLGNRSL